jgi:hypothetical protein
MRIMLAILSSFAGLVLILHADILFRLTDLIGGSVRPDAASAWVGLFGAWALATALVYPAPRAAGWVFGGAGGVGLYVGVSNDFQLLVMWAAVAAGLALLTVIACWEKRAADRSEWHREQREAAVHQALRSLQETVPELLARVPDPDHVAPVRPSPTHSVVSTSVAAAGSQPGFTPDTDDAAPTLRAGGPRREALAVIVRPGLP